jgi:hypothetical protein
MTQNREVQGSYTKHHQGTAADDGEDEEEVSLSFPSVPNSLSEPPARFMTGGRLSTSIDIDSSGGSNSWGGRRG